MNKVKTNEGKVYDVTIHDKTEGEDKKYSYYVYAVNEEHARQIVESYDENAVIEKVEKQFNAISQHYGD